MEIAAERSDPGAGGRHPSSATQPHLRASVGPSPSRRQQRPGADDEHPQRLSVPKPTQVAECLGTKYIRFALAIFRKFDDSFGYDAADVKTGPLSLGSRASHFECNAHDPRRFPGQTFGRPEMV